MHSRVKPRIIAQIRGKKNVYFQVALKRNRVKRNLPVHTTGSSVNNKLVIQIQNLMFPFQFTAHCNLFVMLFLSDIIYWKMFADKVDTSDQFTILWRQNSNGVSYDVTSQSLSTLRQQQYHSILFWKQAVRNLSKNSLSKKYRHKHYLLPLHDSVSTGRQRSGGNCRALSSVSGSNMSGGNCQWQYRTVTRATDRSKRLRLLPGR